MTYDEQYSVVLLVFFKLSILQQFFKISFYLLYRFKNNYVI